MIRTTRNACTCTAATCGQGIPRSSRALDVIDPAEKYYGIGYDLPYAAGHALLSRLELSHDWVLTRRVYNALTSLALLIVLVVIGRRVMGERLAWLPALFLLSMPAFLGQTVMNQKDIPFALGVTVVAATGMALGGYGYFAGRRLDRRLVRDAVFAGGALTLCMLPRGMPGLLGAVVLVPAFLPAVSRPHELGRAAVFWTMVLGLAVVAVVLFNPVFWSRDVLGELRQALLTFSRFPNEMSLLSQCRTVAADALPWHHLAWMLAITTPLPVFALMLAGLGVLVKSAFQRTLAFPELIVLWWAVVPLLLLAGSGAVVFDGIRHVLFVVPALALVAAIGFSRVLDRTSRLADALGLTGRRVAGCGPRAESLVRGASRANRWASSTLVAALLALVVTLPGWIASTRLHPYQFTYYNQLVGGLRGAAGCYETDYWALSFRPAARWLAEHAPAGSRLYVAGARRAGPVRRRERLARRGNNSSAR